MLGKSSWGSFWLAGSDALGESGAELEQQYRGGGKGAQDGGGGGVVRVTSARGGKRPVGDWRGRRRGYGKTSRSGTHAALPADS